MTSLAPRPRPRGVGEASRLADSIVAPELSFPYYSYNIVVLLQRSASVLFHSSRSPWRPTPFDLPIDQCFGLYSTFYFTADIGPLLPSPSCSLASQSYADDVQAYKH